MRYHLVRLLKHFIKNDAVFIYERYNVDVIFATCSVSARGLHGLWKEPQDTGLSCLEGRRGRETPHWIPFWISDVSK